MFTKQKKGEKKRENMALWPWPRERYECVVHLNYHPHSSRQLKEAQTSVLEEQTSLVILFPLLRLCSRSYTFFISNYFEKKPILHRTLLYVLKTATDQVYTRCTTV